MFSLEDLFCSVDDFCQQCEPIWHNQLLDNGLAHRKRARSLCLSEIMTILISFHQWSYRNFKAYYLEKRQTQWQNAFPGLGSYGRFALVDTQYLATFVCLSAFLFRPLHR